MRCGICAQYGHVNITVLSCHLEGERGIEHEKSASLPTTRIRDGFEHCGSFHETLKFRPEQVKKKAGPAILV